MVCSRTDLANFSNRYHLRYTGVLSMILDCSSVETTKKSLCEIFDTTEQKLLSVLASVENHDNKTRGILEFEVDNAIFNEIGEPKEGIKTLWFHGTRAQDPESFWKKGLLPRNEMYEEIENYLYSLSHGLERFGESRCINGFTTKNDIKDEGPYGALFKCVTKIGRSFHDYTEEPEIVRDLSDMWLGENADKLIKRFKNDTSPYVVSFLVEHEEEDLLKALLFLKFVEDGKSEHDSCMIVGPFNNFNGSKIHPNQIVDVEKLSDPI